MIEFAASVTLMVAVVGGAVWWSFRHGLRERFGKGGRREHRA
jgi:hypothetical protein